MTDQQFREEIKERITRCEERIEKLQCDDAKSELQKDVDEIKKDIELNEQRIYDIKDQMPNKQTWALITGILLAIVGIVAGVLI